MLIFGSGMSSAASAVLAVRDAVAHARAAFPSGAAPKLAIVFASVGYADIAAVAPLVRELLGPVPIVGGSSGACVYDGDACARQGVAVVLLGGDDLEVAVRTAELGSPDLVEVVPAAEAIARAADDAGRRGFPHYACLVFAPGVTVDGEALVAAIRKGAGARAQLAGGLTGDDLTLDRTRVLADGELRADRIVVTGLFTRAPIGVAARHGWRAVGPLRTVTRADGRWLVQLDGRPAARVWVEDALNAGASPPDDSNDLPLYLANHYELGIVDVGAKNGATEHELIARAPFAISEIGAVQLSASIAEGTRVRILHASRAELLEASAEAAADAVRRAGGRVVGALVLACSGRLAALGDAFPNEPAAIARQIAAPIGGACVFGEIARNVRDYDAFFNTTAVVIAFGA